MPMPREDHENLLSELLNPEIEHSRRTEILQQLRVDYNSVITDDTEKTNKITKLTSDNNDLIVSNSKLFRQAGILSTEDKKDEEQKTFSQSITLEQIEKGL